MQFSEILYIIGFVLVVFFIITGFDDFIWDIFALIKSRRQKENKLEIGELDTVPPKLIALMIAAWKEENVLESVIDTIVRSQIYPKSMYHIFLGVYSNDPDTIKVAGRLENKHPNVHCVINYKEGPTSKAQNLNYVIKQIKEFEKEHDYCFASFTIHDSEDVVHPYELKVTNYLIDKHPALQFPVFPLIKKPTLKNFFKYITTNTYVDEFAENHLITMVSRHRAGAFVPSAGTGFSLSREIIASLGDSVLPENSLTEDYRLSLTLYEEGIQMYYVMERLKRVDWEGNIIWDYIATRSIFPNTFKAAVKQKTRWTLGITMQSYKMRNIFKNDLSFVGRYSLYRDQKAKIGNMLAGIGYPVLIYFIISLFTDLIPIYPLYSISWYLSLVVTLMMIERQLFRGISLYNVYGLRSAFYGTLFPPLVPLRIVWGNIINFTATFRAYLQYFKKDKRIQEEDLDEEVDYDEAALILKEKLEIEEIQVKTEKKFDWAKTEHDFLEKSVLERFNRRLGDILIQKDYIDAVELKHALEKKPAEERLGEYLVRENIISEEEMVESLSSSYNMPYLYEEALKHYNISTLHKGFKKSDMLENLVIPLFVKEDTIIFAYCHKSPLNLMKKIEEICDKKAYLVLASCETIGKGMKMIENQDENREENNKRIEIEKKYSIEQILIIRNYAGNLNRSEEDVIREMGFISS